MTLSTDGTSGRIRKPIRCRSEYLGMTLKEYEVWVHDPDALPQILVARGE
jgi:hypothetical protein